MIISIHKKGDKRKYPNCRGIFIIGIPAKAYAKCLEKKYRNIVQLKLTDAMCGFCPGQRTIDQIFAMEQFFEKWEYVKEVNACFVNLEKACDRISRDKLWAVLLQYGNDGESLIAIKLLYVHALRGLCSYQQRNDASFQRKCGTAPRLFSFSYSVPFFIWIE